MALLHRIKITKPSNLFNHFKRNFFQIHAPRFAPNYTSPFTISDFFHQHHHLTNSTKFQSIIQFREHFLNSRARFFAAPVQVIKKEEEVKALSRPRLNDEIEAEQIRLVMDDNTHVVTSIREAMARAKELKLDLVEVARLAKPPVCRIMDYNKEQYKKQVKQKEKAKIKSAGSLRGGGACKEVRFSQKAELKDLKIKADTVKRLMDRGYRVKCMVLATSEGQDLSGLLSKTLELIEDVAFVESGPIMEKRQGYFVVRHVKFGSSKKGAGSKKSKLKNATDSEVQREISTCSDSNVNSEKQTYAEESCVDSDDIESDLDNDSEVEAPLHVQKDTSWSASSVPSTNQNFNKLSDTRDDVKGTNISRDQQRNSGPASTVRSSQTPNFASNMTPSPQGLENRYARKVPNNDSAVRNPMRAPNGNHPQPPSHAYTPGGFRQPADDGPPPRGFPPRQNDGPPPRGFPPRQNNSPPPRGFPPCQADIPNQARQPDSNFTPHVGSPRPPNFTGNRVSQPPGFGIFSGAKGNPYGTGEADQPFSGSRSSAPRNAATPGNMNSSLSSSDSSTAGDSKKWGIFSGESSNPVPKKNG